MTLIKPTENWVAYVGPFLFPWGQPASRRVYGVARALAESGRNVIIGSGQWGSRETSELTECQRISYASLCDLPSPDATVPAKLIQLFYRSGTRTAAWLDSFSTRPTCVVTYGGGAPFMHRVSAWCRRNAVPLVADVVEWYDGSHMTGGFFGPFHTSAKLAMHYYYPRCDGVIAISEYLAHHFRRGAAKVIRVPPIIDISEVNIHHAPPPSEGRRLKLVYAGTPGKKDLIASVIRAVSSLGALTSRFELIAIGPTEAQIKGLLGTPTIPDFVTITGKLPQQAVSIQLQQADFSVLLREPKRFAQAGFSTKFVESLANGTPVIGNHTSDLPMYLRDMETGIVCTDHSEDAFAKALVRIAALSPIQLTSMRECARSEAMSAFDYRNYTSDLSSFLDSLRHEDSHKDTV